MLEREFQSTRTAITATRPPIHIFRRCLLLPHTGAAAALAVAEKRREAMASHEVLGPAPIRFSASFGVAALDRSASDIDALLQRADEALYEAKAQGRNRCTLWRAGAFQQVLKPARIADFVRRSRSPL